MPPRLKSSRFTWSGQLFANAFEASRLTVDEFRAQLGQLGIPTTRDRIQRWKNEESEPSFGTSVAIAKILNCLVEDLARQLPDPVVK